MIKSQVVKIKKKKTETLVFYFCLERKHNRLLYIGNKCKVRKMKVFAHIMVRFEIGNYE